jgi:histone-lysine N-methyltransferase SUV39H
LYLGEVLTAEQTEAREKSHKTTKASYLFALDMFDSNPNNIYNVDGRYKGNATRFMNHSCKPNCKLFTVLYDHADQGIYDLAFFAAEDISPGKELTFDYNPSLSDSGSGNRAKKGTRSNVVNEEVATECLCGADNCRGTVWL